MLKNGMDKVFILFNSISIIAIIVCLTVTMPVNIQFSILGTAFAFPVITILCLFVYGIYKLIKR